MSTFSLLFEMLSLFLRSSLSLNLWEFKLSLYLYVHVKNDFDQALGRVGLHTVHTEGLPFHSETLSEISSSLSSLPNL